MDGNTFHIHEVEDKILKDDVFPKLIYRLKALFFAEFEKIILEFIWKCKGHK